LFSGGSLFIYKNNLGDNYPDTGGDYKMLITTDNAMMASAMGLD